MPSVVPDEYEYRQLFGYVKKVDRTGPYAINSGGTATLIGTPSGPPPEPGDPGELMWTFPLLTVAA